jgi:hypothetical protein
VVTADDHDLGGADHPANGSSHDSGMSVEGHEVWGLRDHREFWQDRHPDALIAAPRGAPRRAVATR